MSDLIFYSHSDCLLKDTAPHHPERKERIEAILKDTNELLEKIIHRLLSK